MPNGKTAEIEVTMTVTPAMARVIERALYAWENQIDGLVDGLRRCPWDHHDMDREEGEEVPGALTHESGYRALIRYSLDEAKRVTGRD